MHWGRRLSGLEDTSSQGAGSATAGAVSCQWPSWPMAPEAGRLEAQAVDGGSSPCAFSKVELRCRLAPSLGPALPPGGRVGSASLGREPRVLTLAPHPGRPSSQPELDWLRGPERSSTPTSSASGPAGVPKDMAKSQKTYSTWQDMGLLTVVPTAPEPMGTDTVATSASASTLPAGAGDENRNSVFLVKVEPGSNTREKTTHPPSETTPHPATHRVSTARATTIQAPVTSQALRDMQPGHHMTSAPEGHGHLDPHTLSVEDGGSSATERAAEVGIATQFPAGEGSGEQVSVCPR